jgi:hypothetical protein
MKTHDPRQLELFSDGARAVAAAKRAPAPRPTEDDLQAKLDAARMRLHEIVILSMKTWLPEEPAAGCRLRRVVGRPSAAKIERYGYTGPA